VGNVGSVNQIMGGGNEFRINMSKGNSGDVFVDHREFVQNITATFAAGVTVSPFAITSLPINPGMGISFPFLSQIAENYTLYEFMGIGYEYRPTSGEQGSISNSLGKVILSTQYDPDAPEFGSAIEMENYGYTNSVKPSVGALHGVETASSQSTMKMMYVRTSDATQKDRAFTDIGTFQIATEGINGAANTVAVIGELWVTYKIKLSRPQLFSTILGRETEIDVFQAGCSATDICDPTNSATQKAAAGGSLTWGNQPTTQSWIDAGGVGRVGTNTMIPKLTNGIGCVAQSRTGATTVSLDIIFPQNTSIGQRFEIQVGFRGSAIALTGNQVANLVGIRGDLMAVTAANNTTTVNIPVMAMAAGQIAGVLNAICVTTNTFIVTQANPVISLTFATGCRINEIVQVIIVKTNQRVFQPGV